MSFVIEKNIPIFDIKEGRGRKPIYPFADMEVGDSFSLKLSDRKRVSVACSVYGRRNKKTFAIRNNGTEVRCWRTS